MTSFLQNYDIYFPIQLWKSKASHYRLHPPLFGTVDRYEFHQYFWETWVPSTSDEYHRLQDEWTLITTIWALNPKYQSSLNRGFASAIIVQSERFPYHSQSVTIFSDPMLIFTPDYLFKFRFGFCAYNIHVRHTDLLYLNYDEGKDRLELELCDSQRGCLFRQDYSFLPSFEGKQVSCYDLHNTKNAIFLYVFRQRPDGQYFKMTSEKICIPSDNSKDFPSFFDCMRQSVQPKVLRSNVYTASSNQDLQKVMYTYPSSFFVDYGTLWLPSLLVLLLILSCLLLRMT